MRVWTYYILWKTRNGQKLWDGPYATRGIAQGALDMITDARETGSGLVVPYSADEPARTP